ncbi:hypothetical protein I4U23_027092 [Adineta vaga]|nr:hypothetical protein I4U23_027092 [Adineta vaga]
MNLNKDEIRVLILNENENKNEELFHLKKGYYLQIILSSSLTYKNIRFFTNYSNDNFQRNKYEEFQWISSSNNSFDRANRYVLIHCLKSGSFRYYFTIDGSNYKENRNGQGYFHISIDLILSNEILNPNSITCQTILSKCLGSYSEWLSRLEVSYHSGYNFLHFTPIQSLSEISNSSYSIKDHHKLNSLFQCSYEQIGKIIEEIYQKWNIFSLSDLVYNHVAIDCLLISNHPEITYNLINSPYLKSAVLLDSILIQFTRDIHEGKLLYKGISRDIKEDQFELIRKYLLDEQIPKYRLWEYYIVDIDRIIQEFHEFLSKENDCPEKSSNKKLEIEHKTYQRMKSSINFQSAKEIYFYQRKDFNEKNQWIKFACEDLKNDLINLNKNFIQNLNEKLSRAIDNCLKSFYYRFFSYDGPKYKQISFPSILFVPNYFSYPNQQFKHPDEINLLIENDTQYQTFLMAHNGWVINDDPRRNFANEGEDVYLCRDLIPWCDLIKLRFGSRSDDCPMLYSYMKEYTRLIAKTFHGCRLDNCHSTPIWFLQEMMDYAREIDTNFYINAELFTGNISIDNYYINQIGINSLIRESYRAFDPYQLGEMISIISQSNPIGSFLQLNISPLKSTKLYSLFYDQTHDNPSLIQRRSVEDLLPRSACVAMTNSPIGSNRGYDELIPHYIDVVHETRFYAKWGYKQQQVNEKTAMIAIRKALNHLHINLCQQGFTQLMIDQLSSSALLITRHNPINHQSILLIAHTSFYQSNEKWEYISSLTIEGIINEILFEGTIHHPQNEESVRDFQRSKTYLNGLEKTKIYFKEHVLIEQSRCIRLTSPNSPDYTGYRTIEFTDEFSPGSIIALQISLLPQISQSISNLKEMLNQFDNFQSEFFEIIRKLTLIDLQRILYRSSNEEQADGNGFDVYTIPDYGKLNYCGLQGLMSILEKIRLQNSLRHPLIVNLKQGNWLIDYIVNRLQIYSTTKQLSQWLEKAFSYVKTLTRVMIPVYFDLIITKTYRILLEHGWSLMTPFISQSSTFIRALAQTSIQLISIVPNARLPLLSSNLRQPQPIQDIDQQTMEQIQQCPSLAAGLPHFSSGIWRNWGRDTFISLRGLLLLTGRYEEARYLILAYAGCLRHGLIPNLLADGKNARYNARDAVWWWLYSISNYTNSVPNGYEILSDIVSRLYPTDDSPLQSVGLHEQTLSDVIQEILIRHIQSVKFCERGAGPLLDSDMTNVGFNNQIGIDLKTGFVYGGNQWNCGTWMDKMGSSNKAKNKGHPATPRDGSAIELIGLCRAILTWLIQMNKQGYYPYDSVQTSLSSGDEIDISFQKWIDQIDENFEKEFWIDLTNSSKYVNRKEIYKDTINSTFQWTDFQLRPNFLIAAVVAPEMFDKTHIWLALKQVEQILLGKYGIKTLDPNDYNYIGDYVNDDDSNDYKRAHGFNYHNGPEWLWLTGYYIRAKLYWSKQQDDPLIVEQTIAHIEKILSAHMELILSNDWKGLPELTNADGKLCPYSCSVQAWSSATLLEALYDLTQTKN